MCLMYKHVHEQYDVRGGKGVRRFLFSGCCREVNKPPSWAAVYPRVCVYIYVFGTYLYIYIYTLSPWQLCSVSRRAVGHDPVVCFSTFRLSTPSDSRKSTFSRKHFDRLSFLIFFHAVYVTR